MIHPQAIIDPSASLDESVDVGPYSVVGPDVVIGAGSTIGPHVVLEGPTTIGKNNKIYQFASVGGAPQDKKYDDEPTQLVIGDNNVIREYCTISRGTVQDEGLTSIGNDNWIMAYVHIAHDCRVGNNTIFANSASLAGHVTVGNFAILGGFTLVHQFCKVGDHCFTAMNSVISKDVPPYVMVSGHMAKPHGLNLEGLKRRQFSSDTLTKIRKAYKIVYRSGLTKEQALEQLSDLADNCPEVGLFRDFINSATRGIVR